MARVADGDRMDDDTAPFEELTRQLWDERPRDARTGTPSDVGARLDGSQEAHLAVEITELQIQQVVHEATLQALDRALPPSLLSFLR